MKKIILTIVLGTILGLLIFTMIGCGYAPMKESCVITTINQSYDKCSYHGIGAHNGLGYRQLKFFDTCGKFQIGDTINFIKIGDTINFIKK